jgi:type III restriction enzyme
LRKKKVLFEQGVKALTLFFMESDTSLFRGDNPKVKTIFEEEYKKQYTEIVSKLDQTSDPYYKFLQNDFDSEILYRFTRDIFQATKEMQTKK